MATDFWNHKKLLGLTAERDTEYPHGTLGLRFKVAKSGRKTWVWQRMMDGARHKKTLGRFPAMTETNARAAAEELNDRLENGLELSPAPTSEPDRMTVREAFDRYMADCRRRALKSADNREAKGLSDIVAVAGDKYVSDVTPDDVREMVAQPIIRAKTNKNANTGGVVGSNHTVTLCRMFFQFCLENEYDDLRRTPALAVKKVRRIQGRRKRRVLSMRELALVVLAARQFDKEAAGNSSWADIITIMALHGNRKSEVFDMMAKEWDAGKGRWTIPALRYKTGVDCELDVGPTARAIFERNKDRFLFMFPNCTGVRTKHDTHVRDRLTEIMEEIGGEPIEHWTFHAIRYGFRTNIRKERICDSEVAEKIVHPKELAAVDYDFDFDEEKREALAAWDKRLNEEIDSIVAARMVAVA